MFKVIKSILPVVKADDLVDPQAELRASCKTKGSIQGLYSKFQKCNDRVNSKSQTTENCTEEFFDYLHELDHCVAHSLWPHLR